MRGVDASDRANCSKLTRLYPTLNILPACASVLIGMCRRLVVPVAVASLLVVGCEQRPSGSPNGQSANSPSPVPTATPASTPETAASPPGTPTPETIPSPLNSPAPASTPEAQTTPTATPETAPTAPASSPTATPDGVVPSPTSSPSAVESEGRPTLSSKSANEYLQSYDAYISDFKSAYEAMKQGDMSKYQSVIQRAMELQTKSEKLAGELTPEEEQRFANYLNKKANELAQFASQNR
jgi:hypothetical protein